MGGFELINEPSRIRASLGIPFQDRLLIDDSCHLSRFGYMLRKKSAQCTTKRSGSEYLKEKTVVVKVKQFSPLKRLRWCYVWSK